jgi:sporulation protein YlmC with PRC-barrel domain
MKLDYGKTIYNAKDEKLGELENVVIDPETKEVTHLVSKKGFLFTTDKVIPIGMVSKEDEDGIYLGNFSGDEKDLPDFMQMHYVEVKQANQIRSANYTNMTTFLPYPSLGFGTLAHFPYRGRPKSTESWIEVNIPDDTTAIQKGIEVYTFDGKHIGDVDKVFMDSFTDKVSHFVVSEGFLFKDKKLVPILWVKEIKASRITLYVDEKIFEYLPEYEEES